MLMMTCFEAQKEGVGFLWLYTVSKGRVLSFTILHLAGVSSVSRFNDSWPGYNLVSLLELSQSKILPESLNRLFPRVHVKLTYFSILLHLCL